jgi:hypothetical protein
MIKTIFMGYTGFRILPMHRHTKEGSYIEICAEFGSISNQYYSDEANGPILEDSFFRKKACVGQLVLEDIFWEMKESHWFLVLAYYTILQISGQMMRSVLNSLIKTMREKKYSIQSI